MSELDEAYQRVRLSGPERDGWLSNHAPMAVEALTWHGHGEAVHRWLDGYADRLADRPRGIAPIAADEWRDPLGDPVRTGDWLDYFDRELADEPWRQVLARWWPRLLPGIAAGATHGVIRVGHAVRALLDQQTAPRIGELGNGLAYWAARWQPLAPPGAGPYLATDPRTALDAVPPVPDQRYGVRARLAQLADLPGWPAVAGAVPHSEEHVRETTADEDAVPVRLAGIVHAAVVRHGTHGYANPVMLIHAATAPNAVLRTLPALPATLWADSLAAAWAATAAVTAAYAPTTGRPAPPAAPDVDPAEVMQHAVDSAGPHAIKFADAALDAYATTSDTTVLAASLLATEQTGRW
ncbi:questin oxidase family protein [Micromonospora sp. NPDC000442]|uniref:questin oxidase family protein n=1 Tax=Micromonospora sp. NPDC000442 TaxID=3364217 RepID=UPI0036B85471